MEGQKQCPECQNYKVNERLTDQIWFYLLVPIAIYFMLNGAVAFGVGLFGATFFVLGRWYKNQQFRSLRTHSTIYFIFWALLFLIAPSSTFAGDAGQSILIFMSAALGTCLFGIVISFIKIRRSESGGQKEMYRCDSCGYKWEEHPPKEHYA